MHRRKLILITILTGGTRGDTQPYLALGLELKKSGHQVRIAAFENYETFAKRNGLEFYPIKGDVSRVATGERMADARQADNPLKILLSFNKLKSFAFDLQKDFFNACTGSDAIVYHPGAAIGFFTAQCLKIPSILATPFPMSPTGEYPALIFYDAPRLGRGFNLITHRVFENIVWMASGSPVKEFWKQEFGHAPGHFTCPYPRQTSRKLPTIISCSKNVFPRPKDWPEYVYNTGYWFLDDEAEWVPSSDLLAFLRGGTPPVYDGFGSVGDPALAVQTTELVIEALRRTGQRGILATGWSGMTKIDHVPDDIFIIDSAPHSWLFPQMAAVVHHGGAATTAAGLRAGVPGILVPYSNDQFAWGRRVYELGVGSKPIPRKKLTMERLSSGIKLALKKEIKEAARQLGSRIQSENGSETAARIILDCLEFSR